MTAQATEILHYQGEVTAMCTQPLDDYFRLLGFNPRFEFNSSGLTRGYIGTWEIRDERLYLIGLNAKLKNGTKANVASVFPGYPDRVFAHWYTGQLRLPQGKILEYRHMDYASIYESDLLIMIEKGVVTHTELRQNVTPGMDKLQFPLPIGEELRKWESVVSQSHNKS